MNYIIGHIKPDLDSTVAPLAYEYYLKNIKNDCTVCQTAIPAIAGIANNETQFVFDKFSVKLPVSLESAKQDDQFILVDHNEGSQRLEGMTNDQVFAIIDHHKLNLSLPEPILVNVRAFGSTNTIIWFMMKAKNVKPTKQLASLMISAILSDTVGLKSSTTTPKDKKALEDLNEFAQIKDFNSLTLEIFKAKSDISDLNPTQIVKNDYKIFDFSGKKVLIDQIETVEQNKVITQKTNLLKAMQQVKEEEKVDHIFVVVSDILNINSKVLYLNDQDGQILKKAFITELKDNITDIGPKLSRKKEIAPAIEKAI